MCSSFRRHNEEVLFVGDKATAYENPFIVMDIEGTDNTYATTGPSHLMAHIWNVHNESEMHSFYRARINMVVKKNEEMHMVNIRQRLDDTAATAGVSELKWEIKQVVAPFVFAFDNSIPMGLRFQFIVIISASTQETASTQFPCSGYLTNMSMLCQNPGTGDFPQWFVLTTDDVDVVDHLLTVAGTNGLRGSSKNSMIFENMQAQNVTSTEYRWNFQHFGSKYIRIVNRAVLNMIYKSQGSDTVTFIVSADFVPFKGSSWKQIYVLETDFINPSASDFTRGFEFGLDLDAVQVAVIATINGTESGVMVCRVVDPSSERVATIVGHGDIMDSSPLNEEGIHNTQNEVGIIPLSGSIGAQSPVMSVGNVKSGQLFVWDFLGEENFTTASEILLVITGKVGREYYSKSNAFHLSAHVYDYNAQGNAAAVSF